MTFKHILESLKNEIFEEGMLQTAEKLEEFLPPHIFDTMQKRKNLQMIFDRFFYRPSNKVRHFDALTISKLITPKFNLSKLLETIIETVESRIMIFVDFDFIIEAKKDEESPYKFEYASRATHLNERFRIALPEDAKRFLESFKDLKLSEILVKTFERHMEILNYHESGFQPYQLLACKIYISETILSE